MGLPPRIGRQPHSVVLRRFPKVFSLARRLYDQTKHTAGGGLRFLTLLMTLIMMITWIVSSQPGTTYAADSEYTGLSAGCESQVASPNGALQELVTPYCRISVHRKSGKDLTGTYSYDSSAAIGFKMKLSDNLKGVVTPDASGYMTVYAPYNNGSMSYCIGSCSGNAPITVTSSSSGAASFSLENPPAAQTASQVVQMPTTGAPDGLSAVGLAAVLITVFGLLLVMARRRS